MATVVDLSALGSLGFAIEGASAYDQAGQSVSGAGDVNGDGFDDIIVGAPLGEDGDGKAYVLFGRASGFGTIDLANLDSADGFAIQGSDFEYAGLNVSGAGDINGDGFDDLMVSTQSGSYYYAGRPTAYIIFGTADASGTIDLANLAASDGFIIEGANDVYGFAGLSVSAAGDVNGDGFDDMIVGDKYGNDYAGAAYVIFGKASGLGPIDLSDLDPVDGFAILGDAANDEAGRSVSGAGDVNGDGFDDIIVGAYGANDAGNYAGEAYVIFGKASGFGTIDLANLAPADGFTIRGDAAEDRAGFSVSGAGDVNGDGLADIIIGALTGDDGGSNAGEAYVIFGKAGGFGTVDLSTIGLTDGFIIRGDAASDFAGFSVSEAGDVNGDGFDDVIVGATGGDDGGVDAGEAYVIFGKASGFGTIDLANLDPEDGFVVQGESAGDGAGHSVSGAGDLNDDGFADIIVGAPGNDDAGDFAGAAYVIFGAAPTSGVRRIGSAADQTIRGGSGDDHLDGREGGDNLFGAGGNDRLFGSSGSDSLDGGEGNDNLNGGSGVDTMRGGSGNDIYVVDNGSDRLVEFGGQGTDSVLASVSRVLHANFERLTLTGTATISGTGNDLDNSLKGNSANNNLSGRGGNDLLYGNEGADALRGEDGNDWLEGGAGRDRYFGGSGSDRFVFRDGHFSGTTSSTADQIHDFGDAEGDRIRLDLVDANTLAGGDQDFTFLGTGAFSGTAGELRFEQISGNTFVQGDTNGDAVADFWIRLDGLHTLAGDDFLF